MQQAGLRTKPQKLNSCSAGGGLCCHPKSPVGVNVSGASFFRHTHPDHYGIGKREIFLAILSNGNYPYFFGRGSGKSRLSV